MSLAELMIAMTLGLMLTMGLATLFTQTRQSFSQDEQVAIMQSGLRFAMEELVRDATMAGFWGGLLEPVGITITGTLGIDAASDCGAGWAQTLLPPLGGANNATGTAANAAFPCIAATEFRATTDAVAFKRVLGNAIPNSPSDCDHAFGSGQALVANTIYLADNGVAGTLFKHPEPSGIGGCVENRQLAPVVYYIRNFTTTAGDGIPSLCRKVLQMGAAPAMTTECLVDGIEQLQVEYGIDTSGDGVANRYISAPTAAQFALVTSLRIHLLSRALRPDPNYTNPKTYVLGDLTVTPNDNFYRRAATTTVVVRNPTNLRNLGN